VRWTWTGSLPHSVESLGRPDFPSSGILTGSGTHVVTFTTAGTYDYDCVVHGSAMTGRVIVR
jgi:plastocyanin